MSADPGTPEAPLAAERAIVGICHRLNGQLAAASAYIYLLRRRGLLGDMDEAVQGHMDDLAHSVRLIRSLCREPEPDAAPVALSLLAETANEMMDNYPEGQVVFVIPKEELSGVLRADWARALRALLIAGAWISRDVSDAVTVEMSLRHDDAGALHLRAVGDLPRPSEQRVVAGEMGSPGLTIERTNPRALAIRFES